MKVCRRATFNAAHRLFLEDWSDEQNKDVFGKCSNPNYHGHNYVNLNLDCSEFKNLNPTAENIALVCWRLLRARLDSKYNLIIKLWETENNVVECDGGD